MAYQAENERVVMDMRGKGYTLKQIGEKIGKSSERVRQIEAKWWRKKRAADEAQAKRAEAELLCSNGADIKDFPIDWFVLWANLSVRTTNCLKNSRIKTVGDLLEKSDIELMKTKNFGRRTLLEIRQAIKCLDFLNENA